MELRHYIHQLILLMGSPQRFSNREIVHCLDPFDIRFRYEVQLSGGNDSEKAAAPVNSGSYSSDRSDRATSERAIGTAE